MRQICTQIALFCLLVIGQNVYAQNSLAISKNSPSPAPNFGTPDSVSAANGFTSTNTGTFHDFAPNQTDTIVSPLYYYTAPHAVINFVFSTSAAVAGGGVSATPTVLIITANGQTSSASASATFKGASVDYYFTFNLATALAANTNFKIVVIMTLTDKAVAVNTLATDARRGTAPAGAPTPLPVKFAGFYAKKTGTGISLTWNVGTEENVSGYEVQKANDGKNFTKIGFVAANKSSYYNFIDGKITDLAYYRIKSVDNDGKYAYSTVVTVKGEQSSVIMKAFPMPVQNQLTVQHSTANNNSKIEIISADGRLVKSVSIAEGAQQTNIDISAAKPGVYVVRFVDDSNMETLKIVKQ